MLVVAFIIAKQQPESAAGKRIRHYYHALGAATVVDKTKGMARGVRGKVVKDRKPAPETVTAEVVEEPPADKEAVVKASAKKAS
ncbi:MAG: hypothetical protein GWN12_11675, partial [Thermoplasmata archaeon]|nr:hypothetical protein [Thermoplasmata archaeon]